MLNIGLATTIFHHEYINIEPNDYGLDGWSRWSVERDDGRTMALVSTSQPSAQGRVRDSVVDFPLLLL